jgi:hypothetical protein
MLDFNGEMLVKNADPLAYPSPGLGSALLLVALFLEAVVSDLFKLK